MNRAGAREEVPDKLRQSDSRVIGAVRGSVLVVPPMARATPRIPSAVPFAGFDRPVLDEITNVHSPLRLFRPPRDTFHVHHVTQLSVQVLFLGSRQQGA